MNVSASNGRLLKGLVALAMVCATAQVFGASIREDSFESYSDLYEITNATTWAASGSDISIVVASNYTYTAATMPLSASAPSTAHTKVLQLDTQGDQLVNDVSATGEDIVYIDQMVYLVPSDGEPSLDADTSIQFAVYLNSSSNIVVYNGGSNGITETHTEITSTNVVPNTWVRLTITADYTSGNGFGGINYDWFKVAVDGVDLTSPDGYTIPVANGTTVPTTGPWFQSANKGVATYDQLNGISYQGTGMIDDLVVTTVEPTFEEGTVVGSFTIASVVGSNGSIDTDLSFEIASGASTQIVFSADTYYKIASLEINGLPVTDTGTPIDFDATTYTSLPVDYTTVGADVSNNVTFAVIITDGAPATWYGPLGIGEPAALDGDGDGYTLGEEYVAGMDPTVGADFEITGFSIDGSGYLTVTWNGADSPVVSDDPSTLSAMGADTVGGTPAAIPGAATFSGGVWTWVSTAPVPAATKFIYLSAAAL